jgi:hypothetical protein
MDAMKRQGIEITQSRENTWTWVYYSNSVPVARSVREYTSKAAAVGGLCLARKGLASAKAVVVLALTPLTTSIEITEENQSTSPDDVSSHSKKEEKLNPALK